MKQLLQTIIFICTFLPLHTHAIIIDDVYLDPAPILLEGLDNSIGSRATVNRINGWGYNVNMYGGLVNELMGQDASFNMFGGVVNRLTFLEFSSVNLNRGVIRSINFRGEDNRFTMAGGLVDEVFMANTAFVSMTSGSVNSILGGLGSEVSILGGNVGRLSGFMSSTIYLRYGMLTDLSDLDPTAVVIYVSEPPVLGGLLAGLALLAWRRRPAHL